jgi:hypothetical protein
MLEEKKISVEIREQYRVIICDRRSYKIGGFTERPRKRKCNA